MTLQQMLNGFSQRFRSRPLPSEPQLIAKGWNAYAKRWHPRRFRALPGLPVQHVGDEWTAEDERSGGTTYGLSADILSRFDRYLVSALLDPYLPPDAAEGLEIGPGGGRLTALLIPRTRRLHVAEPSPSMLRRLQQRFAGVEMLSCYQTDGMSLPALPPASLDYVIAFDVFVHFEPRLIFWYLRQIAHLLKPGGTGIIHYANILTSVGWRQFAQDLKWNVQRRTDFAAFGVLCPELMARLLDALELRVISADVRVIPRDAIAVFRKP